jgi:hypothetical protein
MQMYRSNIPTVAFEIQLTISACSIDQRISVLAVTVGLLWCAKQSLCSFSACFELYLLIRRYPFAGVDSRERARCLTTSGHMTTYSLTLTYLALCSMQIQRLFEATSFTLANKLQCYFVQERKESRLLFYDPSEYDVTEEGLGD